ncbi:MAG: glycosyltransferase family 39 protein [Candidatus Aenigmarchaeota archaeon]|nr:glycosyltransferase family 39 protein [Candidatus Aenigmarchaeota archaeon]
MYTKENKILFAIFLLAFIMRVMFFDTSYIIWDESIYLMHGELYAGMDVGYEETFLRPPLLPFLLSPFALLSHESYEIISKIFMILLNSLIVIPVYLLARRINKKAGLLTALLIAILPVSINSSRYVLTDHPGAILALLSFVLFFSGTKDKKPVLVYAGAFVLGLAILMKFTNMLVFLLILPLCYMLLSKKRTNECVLAPIIFLLTVAPYAIYNLIKFKDPIYPLTRAFHVVSENDPIKLDFLFYIFHDVFGSVFLVLSIVGIYMFVKQSILNEGRKEEKIFNSVLLFAFFSVFAYFVFIAGRGTAKPIGIEWEIERFALLLIPFALSFCAYAIIELSQKIPKRIRNAAIIVLLVIAFAFLLPQYTRTYTPQIEFEDGLRHATVDISEYIKNQNITDISCIGNCPPVAYYSQKKIDVFYNKDALLESHAKYILAFEPINSESIALVEKTCNKTRCAYLYRHLF